MVCRRGIHQSNKLSAHLRVLDTLSPLPKGQLRIIQKLLQPDDGNTRGFYQCREELRPKLPLLRSSSSEFGFINQTLHIGKLLASRYSPNHKLMNFVELEGFNQDLNRLRYRTMLGMIFP